MTRPALSGAAIDLGGYVISGAGMVSSLGMCVQACAAARAGITRARQLPFEAGMDGLEPARVVGHPVPFLDGYEGFGRLAAMVRLALEDLSERWPGTGLAAKRISTIMVVPPAEERAELLADVEAMSPAPDTPASLGNLLFDRCRDCAPWGRRAPFQCIEGENAAAFEALLAATRQLSSGSADACVVCCVDSLLDRSMLETLLIDHRLKTASNPTGLMPGECAVAFAVERSRPELRSDGRPAGRLVRLGQADVAPEEEPGASISALSAAMTRALRPGSHGPALALVDLNGEPRRADVWGSALVRARAVQPSLDALRTLIPATSFGDVGAATGGLFICLALAAFARGYAGGDEVLLVCSATGDRAARTLLVASPPG